MSNPLFDRITQHRLPVVIQSEAAECGLACLAMIAGYYGLEIDLNSLRRRINISLRGVTLYDLVKHASNLGLSSRPVRVEIHGLGLLKCPAILHWNLNHFVVLRSVSKKRVVIHDPGQGIRRLAFDQVSESFTGVALELSPTDAFAPVKSVQRLRIRDLWSKISGLPAALTHILSLSLVIQFFALLLPIYLQIAVDEVIVSMDSDLLLALFIGFCGVIVIHALTEAFRNQMLAFFGSQLSLQMSANLFRHLLYLPMTFFERRHIGDIVSRFQSTGPVSDLFSQRLIAAVIDGLFSIAALAMMFIYEPRMAGVALGFILTYTLIRLALLIPLRARSLEFISAAAREQSTFLETLRACQSIKLFGAEAIRHAIWQNRYVDRVQSQLQVTHVEIFQEFARRLFLGIGRIVIIYMGALFVMSGDISLGMLFAFVAYELEFQTRAAALIQQLIAFRLVSLHLDRIADIVHTPTEPDAGRQPAVARTVTGELAFRHVSFRYADSEPLLLRDVSFVVRPKEMLAIAGPSGSGKTTLLKIAVGLLEPAEGDVLIDGCPLRDFGIASYREQVAAVMQDDQLISGTIADNISFHDPQQAFHHIQDCARSACIHDDIMAMPMAYDSMVGDMGTVLSGGQRQRILLARALYRRPEVLFLDEGTAHLDIETERVVSRNLKDLSITRILVAHRPETLVSADRILVLEEGTLREPTSLFESVLASSPLSR